MKSVGAQLREARQARGWTPKAAAKATKIKEQQLLSIESDEYNKFAAPAYVRGFVRIYAKTLGLNEGKILMELDKVLAAEGDDVYLSSSPVQYLPGSDDRKLVTPRRLLLLFAVAVLGAMVTIMVIHVCQVLPKRQVVVAPAKPKSAVDDIPTAPAVTPDGVAVKKAVPVSGDDSEPVAKAAAVDGSAPAPAAVPVAVPVAGAVPPAGVPAASENLIIQAREDCWVRISIVEKDQAHEIFSGTMKAGDEKRFTGDKFQLKIAIPAALVVTFNGDVYHPDTRVPGDFSLPPQ